MSYFAGIKNGQIKIISNTSFNCDGLETIQLPEELSSIPSGELIVNYKFKNNQFVSNKSMKNANQLKVALVSNWKTSCGIATYAENLFGRIMSQVGDFKLFIEKQDEFIGTVNIADGYNFSPSKISACWKRGESLSDLVNKLKEYDPDVILIQHEFGLFPNSRYWLSMMNQLSDYRVIVTMHSVFHHRDKTICEAAIPEIVTHLEGGYDVLKIEKQVPGKVHVIPHGCTPCDNPEKLWNFYKSEQTFMQFGFGFRYKGWENCIKAVALLKQKYKDIFFTGLFSESPYNKVEHHLYYNELMDLIKSLGVEENVAIIRGFQSDTSLDSYLRTNMVTLFPYVSDDAHEVFGASGAARLAMSKGIPVITSTVNHFSDLPTLKANGPDEIAGMLSKVFSDKKFCEDQINRQSAYLSENTWEKVAQKYISIFENGL